VFQESRRHARVVRKASRLDVAELIEIAAMKGMAVAAAAAAEAAAGEAVPPADHAGEAVPPADAAGEAVPPVDPSDNEDELAAEAAAASEEEDA
jgi:hypothetical protein